MLICDPMSLFTAISYPTYSIILVRDKPPESYIYQWLELDT